ncbi:hypothetical protein EJB05_14237, partial [Eragrostis curvula]
MALTLLDDLVQEILLRLPPGEPACLVRCSLVCKPWRRILSAPDFHRRYRAFHGAPLLGFLHNVYSREKVPIYRFVTTTAAPPFPLPALESGLWRALDCRHGRVLLERKNWWHYLVVWNPVTGHRQRLYLPGAVELSWSLRFGAVLCARRGCDGGPFLVVFVSVPPPPPPPPPKQRTVVQASKFSSETGKWSSPSSLVHLSIDDNSPMRGALVGNEKVCFKSKRSKKIIVYDLGKRSLSAIDSPNEYFWTFCDGVLVAMENSSLGLAFIADRCLCLWSRKVEPEGVAEWTCCRVIELQTFFPADKYCFPARVIGFAEGVDVIFLARDDCLFTMDLKSKRLRKVTESVFYRNVLPFISFDTPVGT